MDENLHRPHGGVGQIVSLLMKEGLLSETQLSYAQRVQSKLETPKTLLDIITELGYLTDHQVKTAIRKNMGAIRIGDLLVELGQITASELEIKLEDFVTRLSL